MKKYILVACIYLAVCQTIFALNPSLHKIAYTPWKNENNSCTRIKFCEECCFYEVQKKQHLCFKGGLCIDCEEWSSDFYQYWWHIAEYELYDEFYHKTFVYDYENKISNYKIEPHHIDDDGVCAFCESLVKIE